MYLSKYMKTNITVSVDVEVVEELREQGINISGLVNDILWQLSNKKDSEAIDTLKKRIKTLEEEIKKTKKKTKKTGEKDKKTEENSLNCPKCDNFEGIEQEIKDGWTIDGYKCPKCGERWA